VSGGGASRFGWNQLERGEEWDGSAAQRSRWGRGRFEIVRNFGRTHREALSEVGLGLPLVWCATPVQPSLFIVRRPMTQTEPASASGLG
jgi:hypothetical protein